MVSRVPLQQPALSPREEAGIIHPVYIDATVRRPGYVDIDFDWMPGARTRVRIPRPVAVALGGDLLGLGSALPRATLPPSVARFPGPARPAAAPQATEAIAIPSRDGSRRAGASLLTLVGWCVFAGLLVIGGVLAACSGTGWHAD